MMQKFEWLTEEICKEYIERTKALPPDNGTDVGPWRDLRIELQKRCNLTEIEVKSIKKWIKKRDLEISNLLF